MDKTLGQATLAALCVEGLKRWLHYTSSQGTAWMPGQFTTT